MALLLLAGAGTAEAAAPQAGQYRWQQANASLRIQVGDNAGPGWSSIIRSTVGDWNQSTVIDSPVVPGTSAKGCKSVAGSIQVCSEGYGRNGWLAMTSLSIYQGDRITEATVKLNDSYFQSFGPDSTSWRIRVLCPALGAAYGLLDDSNPRLLGGAGACSATDAAGERPSARSYAALTALYTTAQGRPLMLIRDNGAGAFPVIGDEISSWGTAIHFDDQGRPDRFLLSHEKGLSTVTAVIWAPNEGPRGKARLANR